MYSRCLQFFVYLLYIVGLFPYIVGLFRLLILPNYNGQARLACRYTYLSCSSLSMPNPLIHQRYQLRHMGDGNPQDGMVFPFYYRILLFYWTQRTHSARPSRVQLEDQILLRGPRINPYFFVDRDCLQLQSNCRQ